MLPEAGARWIAFRDAECSKQQWGEYGQSCQPGPFSSGLEYLSGGVLTSNLASTGADRWKLAVAEKFFLRAQGVADGSHVAVTHFCNGTQDAKIVDVMACTFMLEVGDYHRVDLLETQVDPVEPETQLDRIEDKLDRLLVHFT